jgi:chemotaxis protein methyltransferase CheR
MTDAPRTDPGLDAVLRLLGDRTGLHFAPARLAAAESGVRRAMARARAASFEPYLRLLQMDDRALDDVIAELTVGETYFFREPAQFDFIRREVLPEVRRRRGEEHAFRAWSCGCASGEEAYSLAIVLEEEWPGRPASLLGTDVSRAALARALQATYGAWSLRGEGAARAGAYLTRQGERFVLADRVRRRVRFEYLNLALDAYPSFAAGAWGMDLILCRNVLIYLDRGTVARVARRLFDTLAPGGWLIAASSDPPLAGDAPYDSVVTPDGVFYRRVEGPARPQTVPAGREEMAVPRAESVAELARVRAPSPRTPASSATAAPADPLGEAARALADGAYARAAALAATLPTDPAAGALHVRALANLDAARAERTCAEAAARHALAPELHYLHAVLLLDLGRNEEAERVLRRVIYLDRSLAVAHFTLGALAARQGDREAACRAYRNARDLCAARPAAEAVLLAEGEPAGRLAAAASAALAVLETNPEVSP